MKQENINVSVAAFVLFLFFCALRILAAQNEFWIDEIYSIRAVESSGSFFSVIKAYAADNIHPINTFFLSVMPNEARHLYRVPALVFGCGSLMLPYFYSKTRIEAWATFIALGFSFFLVTYSSEARGYAALIFFALLVFYLRERFHEKIEKKNLIVFWISCILGGLAHPTFYFAYVSMLGADFFRFKKDLKKWLIVYGLPTLFLAVFYFNFYRNMLVFGGNQREPSDIIFSLFQLLWGVSGGYTPLRIFFTVASFTFLFLAAFEQRKNRNFDWVFLLVLLAVNFFLPLSTKFSDFLTERYFLLVVLFALIFICRYITSVWGSHRRARAFLIAFVSVYIAGNFWHTARLILVGRGSYTDAVSYIVENTNGTVIKIAGYHDTRIANLFKFYFSDSIKKGKEVQYILRQGTEAEWFISEYEWFMVNAAKNYDIYLFDHLDYGKFPIYPPAVRLTFDKNVYQLEKIFPQFGLSGTNLVLYRKIPK